MDEEKQKLIRKEKLRNDPGHLIDEMDGLDNSIKSKPSDIETFFGSFLTGLKLVCKGDKGDKGEKGETGEKGEQGDIGNDGYTPIKNVDYFDGADGKDGIDGKDGQDGKDANHETIIKEVMKRLPKIQKSKDGKDGKDAEGVDYEKIINEVIRRTPKYAPGSGGFDMSDQRWHGGGSGTATTRDNLSSQCNGVNTVFTLSNKYKSGTVQLWSSEFPIVFNPDVDFLETTATTITLVGIVPQAGQTLVAMYQKA